MITNIHLTSSLTKNLTLKIKAEFEQENHVSKVINNKQFIGRLKKESFNHLLFNVDLYIVDCLFGDCTDEKATIHDYCLHSKIIKQKTPNTINLVTKFAGLHPVKITSKKGSWMLGHKLGHGMYNYVTNSAKFIKHNLEIKKKIESFLQECYNKFHKTNYTNYEKNIKGWDEVFKELSPFKSAQECIIRPDNDEYVYELVAQYSMFGKTSFLFPSCIFSNQIEAKTFSKTIDQLIFESLTNVVGEIIYGD